MIEEIVAFQVVFGMFCHDYTMAVKRTDFMSCSLFLKSGDI